MSKTVLAVGAHPDDIELGCGGTVCYLSNKNYEVICICLTNGEVGGDPDKRVKETTKACKRLGATDIQFGGFPDTKVRNTIELINYLEDICVKYNPEIVFVPSIEETHQDHRNLALACLSAFRAVPIVLAYESPSTRPGFIPSVFFDISDYIDIKKEALEIHETQREKDYMEWKAMINLAYFRGTQTKADLCEAFEPIRLNVNTLLD